MPRTCRPKPLYQRGTFTLVPRPGRNHEIVWYDTGRKRERSLSAGTIDLETGRQALDRLYLQTTGGEYTPPRATRSPLVTAVVADYQLARGDTRTSADAIRHRLKHVVAYIGTLPSAAVTCDSIDERWIGRFRGWMVKRPIANSPRERSPATIENSVLQLAAAIRWAKQVPDFSPIPLTEVTRSPSYRADVATLAAMFRYAMEMPRRAGLLAFLRFSVATWCRPDAALDASTAPRRGQFLADQAAFALNPVGRRQTRKYRSTVPLPACVVEWLGGIDGPVVANGLSKATWRRMAAALGLPGEGQSGMKLIRRSVAHYARPVLGERDWVQGEAMLGHRKPSTSDIYALPDPAHLGLALAATERLIAEIEAVTPGALYRAFTAQGDNVVCIGSRKNG